ncbi:hypothetical protein M885DRAFT_526942 [Pelagophyceae sp. CCMP2097]|nr:hypothetical protein M885DRAFT_526942 [Pelagophyceae sp. CCMP2097]|mmetsp:Transcript_21351/g.75976  ORF Transcript_21351/g.75976 Transcript_21351/m.75976 type:complete len:170 (+) Transcript_21351:58-567(+)
MARRLGLAWLTAACGVLQEPRSHGAAPRRGRSLEASLGALRGGAAAPAAGTAIARDFRKEKPTGILDTAIDILEAPMFDLGAGILVIALTVAELSREMATYGARRANWALLCLALSRCLKALLTVLRSTKTALRGYKAYTIVRRGENVFLRHIPDTEADPSAPATAAAP